MTRGDLALAAGAAVAVLMVAFGLTGGRAPAADGALGDGDIAVVDGRPIALADYRQALAAVAADRRNPVAPAVRRRVLDRMIDEELLVRRGRELDLESGDRTLRNALVAAVIDDLVTRGRAATGEPDDAELARFYAAHRARFAPAERLRVHASTTARQPPVPDALLPVGKLRDYLGAGAVAAVLTLEPGESTTVGARVVTLVERETSAAPPLEAVRAEVVAEYRRQAGEDALRRFLAERRARADIAIAEDRL